MQCESRLTLDASAADYVVDVANVVREPALGGDRAADLSRLEGLLDALAVFSRDPAVQVYAVADRSLLTDGRLTPAERRRLDRWYEDRLLEVLPRADDRILELADALELKVVSGDNFLDFHRAYPWIPGSRDRFLRPFPESDGRIGIRPRIMPVPPEWEVSRKEEEGILLEAGVLRRWAPSTHAFVLSRDWRCPEPGCPLFGAGDRPSNALPRRRRDKVVCPAHGVPLTDTGPLPRRTQVKVVMDGTVRGRFMVTAGEPLAVGRAPAGGGVALGAWIDDTAVDSVSRTHVVLTYDGKGLSVVDERSANGTRVRRVRPTGDELFPLYRGVVWKLRQGDSIVLHDRLELLPSGRRFVFEEDATDGTVGFRDAGSAAGPTMVGVPTGPSGQDSHRDDAGERRQGPPGADGPFEPHDGRDEQS
ncbi:FHA domain-containing protein [Streptomyces sp. HPF1205]|uniref:FHA domain-containing protein n=1 Tax=Streptomyces sp. HPF1205 TaxID=2873262 RepID=UPI001CEC4F71|nr:FHA domain-containing protein [Streptomyces sp. HPF1205]